MTSSNGNIFRVTGPLCREFTGHRGIPLTKANGAELWCFSLICVWINDWVNNRDAGDLRPLWSHCNDLQSCDNGIGYDKPTASEVTLTDMVNITVTSSWVRWRLKSPASPIVWSTLGSVEDQRKHQSSASLAFVRGIYRWPVNAPHKRLVTQKFDDVIMKTTSAKRQLVIGECTLS